MTLLPKRYRLKDGSVYWHKLYFDIVPRFLTRYSPPLGHYNYAAYLYQPHHYVHDLYLEAKWFIQRGSRGYSDRDVWGWYRHMARINAAALRHLAEKKMGHPIGMTMKGWRSRLLRMADGFQTIIDLDDDYTTYKRLSHREYRAFLRSQNCRIMRGLKLYIKHFSSLWD